MANVWREPIFDRTLDDVTFAIQQISAWKKSHSHSVDLKVENDKLMLNSDGTAYVNNDAFVLRDNGRVLIENEVLILELGTVYDLKGCLNLTDLARIEDNVTYLSERLTSYRYIIDTNSKEWTKDGLPTMQDMKRIANNIRSIISGFAKSSESITVPDAMLSYQDINSLERNLYLLKQLLDGMEGSFIKSGTYKSGATNRLPIRR